jgi:hypothetical protein
MLLGVPSKVLITGPQKRREGEFAFGEYFLHGRSCRGSDGQL